MSAFDEDYDTFGDLDMAAEDEAEAMAEFSRIIAQDAPPAAGRGGPNANGKRAIVAAAEVNGELQHDLAKPAQPDVVRVEIF